jgi:hypothetical protein
MVTKSLTKGEKIKLEDAGVGGGFSVGVAS